MLSSIESKIGVSLEHIAFEAQRNASAEVFNAYYEKFPGIRLALKLKTSRRVAVWFFHLVARITGMAATRGLEYAPGKHSLVEIRNPFDINLMVANVLGSFETLENKPFAADWHEEGDGSYLLEVKAVEQGSELAERMKVEYKTSLPGNIEIERCGRCGVPLAISRTLAWEENEGLIHDTRSGARIIFLDAYMVTTVLRELAKELGNEIYTMVVEAKKEWTIGHVGELGLAGGDEPLSPEELERAYRSYLEFVPLHGLGNPVSFKMVDGTIEIVVENPYEPSILAGTFQGLFEALEKAASTVVWEYPGKRTVSFTVTPI